MKLIPYFISSVLMLGTIFAENTLQNNYEPSANIALNNTVLAKVADKTITTLDVMKRMDLIFNRAYPDLIDSKAARFQFYMTGWQNTLDELINNELILLEASKKEIKLTDADVREEVENRYGPDVMENLAKLNLTFDEALKITKNEMLVQRMMYYFIRAKADQRTTPNEIKNAYKLYCKENPTKETWGYFVVSIKANDEKVEKEVLEKALALFKDKKEAPKELQDAIKEIEKNYQNCQITISNLYSVSNKEISPSHLEVLSKMQKNSYSDITCQISRTTNKKINRIFYLKDYEKKETESFEQVANKLKDGILNNAFVEESEKYFTKLKEQYQVDKNPNITKDFVPFTLEQ